MPILIKPMDKFTYGNSVEALELIEFLNTLQEAKESPRLAEGIRREVSSVINEYNRVVKLVTIGRWACSGLDTREYNSAAKSCFQHYYFNMLNKIRSKSWRSFLKTRVFAYVRQTAKNKKLL